MRNGMTKLIIPLILAGGAGVRLWPLSRGQAPKQFLRLGEQITFLHQTLKRCSGKLFDQSPIIVGSADNRAQLLDMAQSLNLSADIVLEPMRRNSCAAIVAGSLRALERDPDALVLVLAADHHIPDAEAFHEATLQATVAASAGKIVTFGIVPRHPATGYGYIMPTNDQVGGGALKVQRFVEKPNAETAARYITSGYLWNSGNFLFKARTFVDEVKFLAPDVLIAVQEALLQSERDRDFIRLDAEAFARSPNISVDYAIMEKTNHASVLPVEYFWSDIGTWDAVASALTPDDNGNAMIGRGVMERSRNVLVHSERLLTAVIGCEDIVVITTGDAVLVARKGATEDVKALVDRLRAEGFAETDSPIP
jgi:mannose-1-phosphate guanylyltransferase / mannose-6-phosphate isomerase